MSDTFVKLPGLYGYQRVIDPDADCGSCTNCQYNERRREEVAHLVQGGLGAEAVGSDKPCLRKPQRQREALAQAAQG